MADAPNAPLWGTEWIEANQRYWDAWTQLWPPSAEAGSSGRRPPEPPWDQAMERWWRIMSPPTPPSSRELIERLLEQGKTFLRFGEELTASMARAGGAFQSQDDWQRALRTIAESWQAGFNQSAGDAGFATFWNLPFDTWSRTASAASVFPGDFLESHKPETWGRFADGLHRNMERFLSVPALGYTREVQEQGQEMVRLTLEYHRALQAYSMAFRDLATETLGRLQKRLAERAEQQDPVTSLRGFYDVWVDCSEEAYLELVSTDSYAEVYGRMVNALMALKHHGRNLVDEAVGAMGLPTRHGLNTLQQRQQELRREVVALRRELAAMRSVREELAALRREVDGRKPKPPAGAKSRPRAAAKKRRQRPKEA
jgi:class III poly(R)-hydroxyalkanoic acid synthase PhaE subunit